MLPIHKLKAALEFGTLQKLPHTVIPSDWFGAAGDNPAFCLAVSDQLLGFSVRVSSAPSCDRSKLPGEFHEGLWKMDAAEFFLKEDLTGRYQEFNLSPTGAWWSQCFSAVRSPCGSSHPPAGVRCLSRIEQSSWQAAMILPLKELSIDLSFGRESRGNVNFILGDPQRFYSFAAIPLRQPDFHQPEHFVPFTTPSAAAAS